jgi:WD40 repeat protein
VQRQHSAAAEAAAASNPFTQLLWGKLDESSCCWMNRHTAGPLLLLPLPLVLCCDAQIYVWSVKTGRLLDVLAGHEGPVSGLAFCPTQPLLASCSWDK